MASDTAQYVGSVLWLNPMTDRATRFLVRDGTFWLTLPAIALLYDVPERHVVAILQSIDSAELDPAEGIAILGPHGEPLRSTTHPDGWDPAKGVASWHAMPRILAVGDRLDSELADSIEAQAGSKWSYYLLNAHVEQDLRVRTIEDAWEFANYQISSREDLKTEQEAFISLAKVLKFLADFDEDDPATHAAYNSLQLKFCYAVTGLFKNELIASRASRHKAFAGQTFVNLGSDLVPSTQIRSYLTQTELADLIALYASFNRFLIAYLMAGAPGVSGPVTLSGFLDLVDLFLRETGHDTSTPPQQVTSEMMEAKVKSEFDAWVKWPERIQHHTAIHRQAKEYRLSLTE